MTRVESLRANTAIALPDSFGAIVRWREFADSGSCEVVERSLDGEPTVFRNGATTYLAGWLDATGMLTIVRKLAYSSGLNAGLLPDGLRMRQVEGGALFWNYGNNIIDMSAFSGTSEFLLDGHLLAPSGVTFLRDRQARS